MKKFSVVSLIAIFMILGLTSFQAYAQPAFDSKTPGAKGTEQSIERATERATETGEQARPKNEDKDSQKQNFMGTLVSINATSITLKLDDGTSMTFAITRDTKIKIPGSGKGNGNGKQAPATADIPVGAKVMVQAVAGQAGAPMTARHIMLIPGKPETSHHVGTVTQYTPGKSLTILSQDGQSSAFTLTAQTKILPDERASQLKVGARVTVIYGRNPSGDAPEVRGVVVHPEGSGPKGSATPKP